MSRIELQYRERTLRSAELGLHPCYWTAVGSFAKARANATDVSWSTSDP